MKMEHQNGISGLGIQIFSVSGQERWKRKMVTMPDEKGKVIQFPKKAKPQKEIVIDNTDMELREAVMFADHLTEGLVVNLIHNLTENGVSTNDQGFIRDIGFLIELVKSTIYRDMDMDHPMQDFVDVFVSTTKEDGQLVTRIDVDLMDDVVQSFLDDGDNDNSPV